ncbi:MAG TPA: hypothetical protein VLF20_03435 [Patescibacteria group bacterium]|nr:hypothetical protein [Patescibacteria group bacterium]
MRTKDMLQALIKGQAALEAKIKLSFKEVNEILDKQGKQLHILKMMHRHEKSLIK